MKTAKSVRIEEFGGPEKMSVNTVELPAEIFEVPVNIDLIHQAYLQQMANARLGTHKTKTRSEVAGGGRKPWKQKGTGRARQGSTRAVQWKGGGRVHTPHMLIVIFTVVFTSLRRNKTPAALSAPLDFS